MKRKIIMETVNKINEDRCFCPQKGILGTGICQMFHKCKILLPLSECCLTYHIKITFFAFWYQFWGKYPQNSMFDRCF